MASPRHQNPMPERHDKPEDKDMHNKLEDSGNPASPYGQQSSMQPKPPVSQPAHIPMQEDTHDKPTSPYGQQASMSPKPPVSQPAHVDKQEDAHAQANPHTSPSSQATSPAGQSAHTDKQEDTQHGASQVTSPAGQTAYADKGVLGQHATPEQDAAAGKGYRSLEHTTDNPIPTTPGAQQTPPAKPVPAEKSTPVDKATQVGDRNPPDTGDPSAQARREDRDTKDDARREGRDTKDDGMHADEHAMNPDKPDAPRHHTHVDQHHVVGERVMLNGSLFDMGDVAVPLYQWVLVDPRGAPVPLTNADKVSPSFVPEMAGAYKAMLMTPAGEATVSVTVAEKPKERDRA